MRIGDTENKDCFQWQHLLAWLGGIHCAMVPFIGAWEIGAMKMPMRMGAGNFGLNLLIGVALFALGAILGGYWWRLGKWIQGRYDGVMSGATVLLFLLGIIVNVTDFLHGAFLPVVAVFLMLSLVLAYVYRNKNSSGLGRRKWGGRRWYWDFVDWFRAKSDWNGVFFGLLFLVLMVHNLTLISGLESSGGEKVSALLGRIFTHGLLVGLCYMLAELMMRATPKYLRWVPWLVLGLIPLLVITDQLLGIMWNRSLMDVVNGLNSAGSLDLATELATSGLDVGPVGAWFIVAGVFAIAMIIAAGCWLISKRFQLGISMQTVMVICLLCCLGVIAEQGIGSKWKNTVAWQDEYRAFDLHLGLFAPPQGVAKYRVTFYPGQAESRVHIDLLERRPDVYIFMIESLRSDAVRSDVAPFLCKFRDTECQPFLGTWSASNATHLSWFSFFHSRVSVFWREALEAIADRTDFHGAVPLQQLKEAGYEIEVRAVCDLSYKDFGLSNFGSETKMLTVLEQAEGGDAFSDINIAERERVTFERLRQAVIGRPGGGGFYFTALDSPHYNYYWHKDFKPPFSDYDEDTRFPLNPSQNQVQRVVNRYWNSVAWVDFQLEAFCNFLKKENRYRDSIIIVTGDHGEEFQERGSWFHCSSLRPEQTAVPIFIKWPESIGRGSTQRDVSHIDVIPSLMYALGIPEENIRGLAGRNLLLPDDGYTAICTTAFAGKSGETMVLRRGGYEAVFFWEKYWESQVPSEIVLEFITDPSGKKIALSDASSYTTELKRLFPDAFERYFSSLEIVQITR